MGALGLHLNQFLTRFSSFLYGETVELRSVMTALETLHAAEKYLCDGLMKICATYLVGQLNPQNVLFIYQRTSMYPEADHQQSPSSNVDNRPSAPPLEDCGTPGGESQQQNANLQTQSRSSWCSFLLNSCLEFIDKNASAVLCSEVTTCIFVSTKNILYHSNAVRGERC